MPPKIAAQVNHVPKKALTGWGLSNAAFHPRKNATTWKAPNQSTFISSLDERLGFTAEARPYPQERCDRE